MAFIEIIEPEKATGSLKKIYEELERKRGKLARVHKIQSLNPETITAHMDLYLAVMFGKSPLRRAQREMMAVVVSAVNRCEYCQLHHAEALLHYWKDEDRIDQLRSDYRKVELKAIDRKLCRLAEKLTLNPGEVDENKDIQPLKDAGLSDRAILDAVLVISYFNFVNRLVEGLGVKAEADEVKGYKY